MTHPRIDAERLLDVIVHRSNLRLDRRREGFLEGADLLKVFLVEHVIFR